MRRSLVENAKRKRKRRRDMWVQRRQSSGRLWTQTLVSTATIATRLDARAVPLSTANAALSRRPPAICSERRIPPPRPARLRPRLVGFVLCRRPASSPSQHDSQPALTAVTQAALVYGHVLRASNRDPRDQALLVAMPYPLRVRTTSNRVHLALRWPWATQAPVSLIS